MTPTGRHGLCAHQLFAALPQSALKRCIALYRAAGRGELRTRSARVAALAELPLSEQIALVRNSLLAQELAIACGALGLSAGGGKHAMAQRLIETCFAAVRFAQGPAGSAAQFLPFARARAWARSLGLRNEHEWRAMCRGERSGVGRRPPFIPASPARIYRDRGWRSWGDWLGTGTISNRRRVFLPFREARKHARTLALRNASEWQAYRRGERRDLPAPPAELPRSPLGAYRHDGWRGWDDFLGTDRPRRRRRKLAPPRVPARARDDSRAGAIAVDDLARALGIAERRLKQHLRAAAIRAHRIGGRPHVRAVDVAAKLDVAAVFAERAAATPATRYLKAGLRASRRWVAGHPHLVAEWDVERNGELYPYQIRFASQRRVWWRCAEAADHRWQAPPAYRTSGGQGCPFCAGTRASSTNSVAVIAPHLIGEWHPMKNGELTPAQIVAGSPRLVWWRCARGADHEWRAAPAYRIRGGEGCPMCRSLRVSMTNSLAAVAPQVAARWHPTKNGKLRPDQVVAGSARRVWWQCPRARDHVWRTQVAKLAVAGQGCPFCAGRRASSSNSLAALEPELARQWHRERNGALRPSDVTLGSNRAVWWRCPRRADHVWSASPKSRAMLDTGCPMCAGRAASRDNNLAARFPSLARQWHPDRNGSLRPDAVAAGTGRRVWWKCPRAHDHEWETAVSTRTRAGAGCPFCAGKLPSSTSSLAARFPAIAAEWHPRKNAELRPHDVTYGSRLQIWWRCRADPSHEWRTTPNSRTNKRSGCPECRGRQPRR